MVDPTKVQEAIRAHAVALTARNEANEAEEYAKYRVKNLNYEERREFEEAIDLRYKN